MINEWDNITIELQRYSREIVADTVDKEITKIKTAKVIK